MDFYILQNENALFYECGFSSDNAIFLKLLHKSFFITDARYFKEASEVVRNSRVILAQNGDPIISLKKILKKENVKTIYYNPSEWSVSSFANFSKGLSTKFIQKENLSHKMRVIKTDHEVNLLKQASLKGANAFEKFCEFIKKEGIGLSEKELHFQAETIFKNNGELGLSFSPIVAINENSAKPHALCSDKVLHEGDLLLVDAGITYKKYCSDRTRTVQINKDFNFGKVQKFSDLLKQQVYDTVLKAHEETIKNAKTGMSGYQIDKIARDIIEKAGFGKYFIHSTGHGVGLDIHEEPRISTKSKTIIEEGMIFTIEPGIYLPNEFGVRIEDTVLVTKNGVEVI